MESIFGRLKVILNNAKKSINRPYSIETIEAKKEELQRLQRELEKIINTEDISEEDINDIAYNFNKLRQETLQLLQQHKEKKATDGQRYYLNMDPNELASISKLIPIFTGRKEDLNNFLSNLDLIAETIVQEKQNFFFKFIFNTRLDERVKNRIKQNIVPTNIKDLVAALKSTYRPLKNPNTILNELTGIVQKNDNITGFANKIESLIIELNEIQIAEQGEESRQIIINSNNRIAFNAFLNGLRDHQIVSTIEASQVKTFTEALQIAENTLSRTKQKQILFQNACPAINNNYRYNNNYRNNQADNRNNKYRNNHNNNYNNNYNNRFNRGSNSNRFSNRNNGNFSQNHNNNNNNYNNNNSYNRNYNNRNNNGYRNNNNRRNVNTINEQYDQGNYQTPEVARSPEMETTQ